mmetsp:Transcript_24729/g.48113  ORF Transcript_24729/g.48113 Transcript_24729/m.48113 type:complete len:153 (+) Transcript_24729:3-461(+)
MDSCRVAAIVILATLELEAGRAGHGLSLVLRVTPLALSSGSLTLQAQTHMLIARCLLGGAPSPYPRRSSLQAAEVHLDKAVGILGGLEEREELKTAFHLSALTANALGDVQKRDRAAEMFCKASVELDRGVGVLNQLCLAPQSALDATAHEP